MAKMIKDVKKNEPSEKTVALAVKTIEDNKKSLNRLKNLTDKKFKTPETIVSKGVGSIFKKITKKIGG